MLYFRSDLIAYVNKAYSKKHSDYRGFWTISWILSIFFFFEPLLTLAVISYDFIHLQLFHKVFKDSNCKLRFYESSCFFFYESYLLTIVLFRNSKLIVQLSWSILLPQTRNGSISCSFRCYLSLFILSHSPFIYTFFHFGFE